MRNQQSGGLELLEQSSDHTRVEHSASSAMEARREREGQTKGLVSRRTKSIPRKEWEVGTLIYKYDDCNSYHAIPKYHCAVLCLSSPVAEPVDDSHYNITVVTVGSFNRLFEYSIFASRWNGHFLIYFVTPSPIVFVTYLKEEEMSAFNDFLHNATSTLLCSPRIQHVIYVALPGSFFHSNYPINILRNLGIRQVRTSHFLLLDMDMWLSGIPPSIPSSTDQSYEVLLALPPVIWQDPKAAVVIPAWFHTGWTIANGTLPEQVNSWD